MAPLIAALVLAGGSIAGPSATGFQPAVRPAPARVLTVTYFLTNSRCDSCYRIEAWTRAAVEAGFARELKTGRVVFRTVNIEEKANIHFGDDYQLLTKSVIVSESVKGKDVRWKNLDRIWKLISRPQPEFTAYIQSEIRGWLPAR